MKCLAAANLGFLGVTEPIAELELERRLVEKVKLFLLELGRGFTFIGNQHILAECGIEYGCQIVTPFSFNSPDCLYTFSFAVGN